MKPGSAALVLSFTLAANGLAVAYLLPGASPSRPSDGQKPNDPDELLARAKANGYRRGEHREQDAVPDRHAYIDKTIYDRDGRIALRRGVRVTLFARLQVGSGADPEFQMEA